MRETWAFLNSGFHDAATNMAIDETLLDWHSKGKIPPTIRFYGWKIPSLTVGRFQNVGKTIDFTGVEKHQCDFVRRLTGGSAVLHDDELTYSIIVSESHDMIPHSINEAYYILAKGLLEGYRALGIHADFAKPKPSSFDRSAVCFETPAIYEMMVDGKKVSGNAQTRQKGVLLQHGSIPMSFNADMLFDLFLYSKDSIRQRQKKKFVEKAISINGMTGRKHTYEMLAEAFLHGFKKGLGIDTAEMHLSLAQWKDIEQLRKNKYATELWNKQKGRSVENGQGTRIHQKA